MITLKLSGGFANQMFQYAAGFSLSKKLNTGLTLDVSDYTANNVRRFELNCFDAISNIPVVCYKKTPRIIRALSAESIWMGLTRNAHFTCCFKERNPFEYDKRYEHLPDGSCLVGYFQSEKYFRAISDDLRNEFYFDYNSLPARKFEYAKKILNTNNSVGLHIRRGDYVSNSHANRFHGLCELDYYKKSLNILNSKIGSYELFVFSDDTEWVRQNFPRNIQYHLIDSAGDDKSIYDLKLMSMCKHFVTANSSYSWWGAWMIDNKSKVVISPKNWIRSDLYTHKDLIPEEWLVL